MREYVQPPAVRHPDHDFARALGGRQLDQLVEHRDGHVESLDRELFLAQVGLVHEALERVDLGQPLEQRLLLLGAQRLAEGARLDRLAQPQPLPVRSDVLDLVGDRAAVGLAQVRERLDEGVTGHVHPQDVSGDLRHQLGRQAERSGVERRVALRLAPERIQASRQMAVGAVGLEQRSGRLDGVQQCLVDGDLAGGRGRRGPGRKRRRGRLRQWRQRHAEIGEDLVVEALFAVEQSLDPGQEAARFGALDDAVIIGRGHRHDLLGADQLGDVLDPDGIGDRAGGDDRALPDHQPRDGGDSADPARVGERQVAAAEVVGGERVVARFAHERVVLGHEFAEAQASRVTDHRHDQAPRAVLALDVDGQAEVHGAVANAVRLAINLGEVVCHHRHLVGRDARDRVGDQVRERDPAAGLLELLAALVERRDGKRAERGRGRNRAALLHVASERGARALDQLRPGGHLGGRGWGCGSAVADGEHV